MLTLIASGGDITAYTVAFETWTPSIADGEGLADAESDFEPLGELEIDADSGIYAFDLRSN